MKKTLAWAMTVLVVAACSDASSPSGPTRLAPLMSGNGNLSTQLLPGEYIVVLDDDADVDHAAAASGAQVTARWAHALHGYAVRGATAGHLAAIRANPRVKFVEQDAVVSITATQTPTPSWGLDRIDQSALPLNNAFTYPTNAAGVHVYTIDTGILLTHNDFAGRMAGGFDAVTAGGNANDCHGHGTHVSGTIGGTTYGIAKGVTFHPVRVLDCSGSGTNSAVISGINWVAANKIQPSVANMSLGGGFSAALNTAADNLVLAGVFLAVASGNSAADACGYSPASAALATTVNASTSADARAGFSNFGTCTDIFAPGNGIVSDYIGSNTATGNLSGTSMASPHVAGAGALYRALNPTHTPQQVDAALKANATANVITSAGTGSPNRLLNISFLNGGSGGTPVPVNQAPKANFTINCQTTSSPSSCTLDASSSTDDAGFGGLTFAWANNIGRPAKTGTTATYVTTWAYSSTFDVTLTASDAGGLTHAVTKTVVIPAYGSTPPPSTPPPPPTNQAPIANFTITCDVVSAQHSCTADAAPSTDDGGFANLTFAWANNVGRPAKTGQTARYVATYAYTSTFQVTLTATDAQGLTHSVTKTMAIP